MSAIGQIDAVHSAHRYKARIILWLNRTLLVVVMLLPGYLPLRAEIRATSTKDPGNATGSMAQTFLGPIETSLLVASLSDGIAPAGVSDTTYRSQHYHFQISWPDNLHWSSNEALGKEMMKQMAEPSTTDVPIIISWKDRVVGSVPSVNVVTARIGNVSIADWMNASALELSKVGWHIHSIDINEGSQGGVLTSGVAGFSQVQRFTLASEIAYVVTATMPTKDAFPVELREGLLSIVNSFKVLKR